MKIFFKIFAVLVAAMVLAYFTLPWKDWVAQEMEWRLQAQGLDNPKLHIASVGWNKITFEDIRLGSDEKPMTLKNLSVGYSLNDLRQGKLGDLVLQDLVLDIRQTDGTWALSGVTASDGGGAIEVPATPEAIAGIPVQRLNIENSTINITSPQWHMSIPFGLQWDKAIPGMSVTSHALSFGMKGYKLNTGEGHAAVKFENDLWKGEWDVKDISLTGFPIMAGLGDIGVDAQSLRVKGAIAAEDKSGDVSFSFVYPFAKPEDAKFFITHGSMPWSGGVIAVRDVEVPLQDSKQSLRFNVDIKNVGMNDLMKLITGRDVQATGTLSGQVPVIIQPNGTFTLAHGGLKADQNGVVMMPADVIPGAGEQIDLTRQILSNFEYDAFSIDIQEEKDGVALLLAVSGKNPKVYDGRPVKLNVRLGGDVLEFLQSNIMLFTKPESILQQETE